MLYYSKSGFVSMYHRLQQDCGEHFRLLQLLDYSQLYMFSSALFDSGGVICNLLPVCHAKNVDIELLLIDTSKLYKSPSGRIMLF